VLCRPTIKLDTSSHNFLALSSKNKENIDTIKNIVLLRGSTHPKEPKWSVRQPVEVRRVAYEEARARIFDQQSTEEKTLAGTTSRVQRARTRYESRNQERRRVCDSVKMVVNGDRRAFAEVQLHGHLMLGLLDTGASVSPLGAGGLELLEQLGLQMTPTTTTVQAAGGTRNKIVGKVDVLVQYAKMERSLTLYVCPSLQQHLYLGIDFWRKFGLAPNIVGVEAVDLVESEFLTKSEPVEPHILDASQQQRLEAVKVKFRSYDR